MLNGTDVASYQGNSPNYSGDKVVAVKITGGTDYENPDAKNQIVRARADGAALQFYHYARPRNGAKAEADWFEKNVAPFLKPGDVLDLDWEFFGPAGVGVTQQMANDYKDAWFQEMGARFPDYRAILYAPRYRWLHTDVNSNCGDGLWIAENTTAGHPDIQHAWVGHQFGQVHGQDGDVWNFPTLDVYRTWALGKEPPSFKVQPVDYTKPQHADPKVPTLNVGWLKTARFHDPQAPQGHKGPHADMVRLFEHMLAVTGWLDPKWVDGSYGSLTVGDFNPVGRGGVTGFQVKHSGANRHTADGWMGPKELQLLSKLSGIPVNVHL